MTWNFPSLYASNCYSSRITESLSSRALSENFPISRTPPVFATSWCFSMSFSLLTQKSILRHSFKLNELVPEGDPLSSTPSSSTSLATLSDNCTTAKDIVFIPGNQTRRNELFDKRSKMLLKTHHLLRKITLSKSCSVAQLMILLRVLDDQAPHYTLLKNQCYWYAGMLCEMLRQNFEGIVTDNKKELKAGKYLSYRVSETPAVESNTRTEYDKAWEQFCNEDQQVSTLKQSTKTKRQKQRQVTNRGMTLSSRSQSTRRSWRRSHKKGRARGRRLTG